MTANQKKENPFLNIGLNVVIPSIILTKFSTQETLGEVRGLVIALIFPIVYGIYDFIRQKNINLFSAIGFISILLTGGIGLMQLNKNWLVLKETAIPLVLGVFVLSTMNSKKSLMKVIFRQVFDLEKVNEAYEKSGNPLQFEKDLKNSSLYFGLSFFLSAALNFILAIIVLKGDPGSAQFNESLGKMTALSFPVIALPMMVVMIFIIMKLLKDIKRNTNLDMEHILKHQS